MPLFSYSKSRHIRKLNPGPYIRYQTYKPHLKQEFDDKCVYCLIPDRLKGEESFCVEHYLPKKHFPELKLEYKNLYYSCSICNCYKSNFWPTINDKDNGRFVPNPCDHIMFDHLRYKGAIVITNSVTGGFAEELLHLNDKKFVDYRKMVIEMKGGLELKIKNLKDTIHKTKEKISIIGDEKIEKELADDLKLHEKYLAELEEILFSFEK